MCVQYHERRAENRTGHRQSGCQTALAPKPTRDNHRPGDGVTDTGRTQRDDHKEKKKGGNAGGEAKAEKAGSGDNRAPENQFTGADAVE